MTTKTSLQLDPEAIAKADEQARKWGLSRQQYINIVLKHCEIDLSVILKTETIKKSGRPKTSIGFQNPLKIQVVKTGWNHRKVGDSYDE